MTVAVKTPERIYVEDGVTLNFAVPFRYLDAADLSVQRITADGAVSSLTSAQFSATPGLTDNGGTLTLPASVAGSKLRIRRATVMRQPIDYTTNDSFPAETHEMGLDRLTLIAQDQAVALAALENRSLRVPDGETITVLPASLERRGKYIAFDATGNMIASSGTGTDAGLRADLAAATGTALIGVPEGSLQELLYDRSALVPYQGAGKMVAYTWADCLAMADDLSDMRGFAAWAGTTGGRGKPVFKVWNASDDVNIVGCLRWAVAQAKLAGGGMIVFIEEGWFNVWLRSRLTIDFDNVTIAAPARNVRLLALNSVEHLRVAGKNVILKWLDAEPLPHYTLVDNQFSKYSALAGTLVAGQTVFAAAFNFFSASDIRVTLNRVELVQGVDYTVAGGGGPYGSPGTITLASGVLLDDQVQIFGPNNYMTGAITVQPHLADKVWIQGCTVTDKTDSAMDMYSSQLLPSSGLCRVTVTHGIYRMHNETMSLGSGATSAQSPAPSWAATALDEADRLVVTIDTCLYDGCCQRNPRLAALAFAHVIDCLWLISGFTNDEGTVINGYGVYAATGGKVLIEGGLMRFAGPAIPGYRGTVVATDPWSSTTRTGPGAIKVNGLVAESGILISEANTDKIPALPYSIAYTPVPAEGPLREAYVASILAAVGAEIAPLSESAYGFVDDATATALGVKHDGLHNIKVPGGYRRRLNAYIPAVDLTPETRFTAGSLCFPRGANLTAVSDTITLRSGQAYNAIDTEGGAATDTLATINPPANETFPDGLIIGLRIVSNARTFTVTNTDNIDLPGGSIILDSTAKVLLLRWGASTGKWGVWFSPSAVRVEGRFTPTLANVANTTARANVRGYYRREGGAGATTGKAVFTITPTAGATLTEFSFTLPIASNFAATADCGGSGSAMQGSVVNPINVYADAATDTIRVQFASLNTSPHTVTVLFDYEML